MPVSDSRDSRDRLSGGATIKVKKMTKIYEGSTKFPKLEECHHFHYDFVELGNIQVELSSQEDQENVYHGPASPDSPTSTTSHTSHFDLSPPASPALPDTKTWALQVSAGGRAWTVRRSLANLRLLDKQLHSCIFDRKYSQLPELSGNELQPQSGLQEVRRLMGAYLQRFSAIAGNMINCGPLLNWLEMDNRGNHLMVTDESAINTPAIAAAHVIKRYNARAPDEISFEVGDIISLIDMPPKDETMWWRGKKNFEVGFFPCDCVEVIGDRVPETMASNIPKTPPKPVLRRRGKLISFLRTFFTQRPARTQLKRTGIVKERVFGCDLGEHLLNSSLEVPQVLTTCAEAIEKHGIQDGIYRLSGVASNIQKLRNEFDEEHIPELTDDIYLQDIHSISSVLKAYFRELPNPLFTYQLYSKFAEAIADEDNKLLRIHDVVQQLPPPHYRTAEYLLRHLSRVASYGKETGMHCKNLAIVWAPNLLRSKELEQQCTSTAALQGVCVQAVVTEFLISYVDLLFSDKLHSLNTGAQGNAGRRARPKSLAISTPTKLLSLEEARERALASVTPHQKFIEVGGGPSSLPDKYHTVIDLPNKKKSRKDRKSPVTGLRALFTRSRSTSWRSNSKDSQHSMDHTDMGVEPLSPVEPLALTEEDLARRRQLRSVRSFDSLLSGSSLAPPPTHRLSDEATTIANPYTDERHDGGVRPKAATLERLPRGGKHKGSKKRSISCDTYQQPEQEEQLASPSSPAPPPPAVHYDLQSPVEDPSEPLPSVPPREGVRYYNAHLHNCPPPQQFEYRLPSPQEPPPPSDFTHISPDSDSSHTLSQSSSQHDTQAYSCSPPGDPKRSRSMDYMQAEALPCFSVQPQALPPKQRTLSPQSLKKKKKAPPPPPPEEPLHIDSTEVLTSKSQDSLYLSKPDPLSPIGEIVPMALNESPGSRRKPVTQLLGYEDLETHGIEGAPTSDVALYDNNFTHEDAYHAASLAAAASIHSVEHEDQAMSQGEAERTEFSYMSPQTEQAPSGEMALASPLTPPERDYSPLGRTDLQEREAEENLYIMQSSVTDASPVSDMDIASEMTKSLDSILRGASDLELYTSNDDVPPDFDRGRLLKQLSEETSDPSDHRLTSSEDVSDTLTGGGQLSSSPGLDSDLNAVHQHMTPLSPAAKSQCMKYSSTSASESDNVFIPGELSHPEDSVGVVTGGSAFGSDVEISCLGESEYEPGRDLTMTSSVTMQSTDDSEFEYLKFGPGGLVHVESEAEAQQRLAQSYGDDWMREGPQRPEHLPLNMQQPQQTQQPQQQVETFTEPGMKAESGKLVIRKLRETSPEDPVQVAQTASVKAAPRHMAGKPLTPDQPSPLEEKPVLTALPSGGDGYLADRSSSASPTITSEASKGRMVRKKAQLYGHQADVEVAAQPPELPTPHMDPVQEEHPAPLRASSTEELELEGTRKPSMDRGLMFHMDDLSDRGTRSDSAEFLNMSYDSSEDIFESKKGLRSSMADSLELLSGSSDGLKTPDTDLPPVSLAIEDSGTESTLSEKQDTEPVKTTKSSATSKARSTPQRKKSVRELLSQFETSSTSQSPPTDTETRARPVPKPRSGCSRRAAAKAASYESTLRDQSMEDLHSKSPDNTVMEVSPPVKRDVVAPVGSAPTRLKSKPLVIDTSQEEPVDDTGLRDSASPNVLDKIKTFEIQATTTSAEPAVSSHSLEPRSRRSFSPERKDKPRQWEQEKASAYPAHPDVQIIHSPPEKSVNAFSSRQDSAKTTTRDDEKTPRDSEKKVVIVEKSVPLEPKVPAKVKSEGTEDKPLTFAERMKQFQSSSEITQDVKTGKEAPQQDSLPRKPKRLSEKMKVFEADDTTPSVKVEKPLEIEVRESSLLRESRASSSEEVRSSLRSPHSADEGRLRSPQGRFVTRHTASSREDLSIVGLHGSESASDSAGSEDVKASSLRERRKKFEHKKSATTTSSNTLVSKEDKEKETVDKPAAGSSQQPTVDSSSFRDKDRDVVSSRSNVWTGKMSDNMAWPPSATDRSPTTAEKTPPEITTTTKHMDSGKAADTEQPTQDNRRTKPKVSVRGLSQMFERQVSDSNPSQDSDGSGGGSLRRRVEEDETWTAVL